MVRIHWGVLEFRPLKQVVFIAFWHSEARLPRSAKTASTALTAVTRSSLAQVPRTESSIQEYCKREASSSAVGGLSERDFDLWPGTATSTKIRVLGPHVLGCLQIFVVFRNAMRREKRGQLRAQPKQLQTLLAAAIGSAYVFQLDF